ncbi:DUF397 domain-containing protein [Streptomyces subrutilus]|uniref:DUF397 domain-containing protein n=1 Tax=Streptomyces subrutilus TaxID=36818 RepID=A0A5P2UMG2_9ACTN|nr:DUF397 domain-containing protein [Streptomyces subrutilus]QEU80452.1 DUF397 domain-containing protein [Streptomyces subrutilus]WSJ30252.1 DUF397 domain-containing protein [Streptomyces subrutilus]GGZ75384.1 hypothetical protein GCM10010371_38960 [Streptomyces subrutilus]
MTSTTESPRWFTSSYSNNGGACVQVATNLVSARGVVPVRDSKAPEGPVLEFTAGAFAAFVSGVRSDTAV